jgi:uncharacterized protein DUF4145
MRRAMSETTKSYCNQCVGERNHIVLHTDVQKDTQKIDDDLSIDWYFENDMLKCCGCNTVSLRCKSSDSETLDERGHPQITTAYFPPAIFRHQPVWLTEFPLLFFGTSFIPELLYELYVSIQNDCRRSAAMAVRALLEQVMIDKVGDKGSFIANVREFQAKGFISAAQQQFLETVIEAGHATIHRAFKPSKDDLVALVNIAESVVESVYVNEHRAALLKRRIPPKKR